MRDARGLAAGDGEPPLPCSRQQHAARQLPDQTDNYLKIIPSLLVTYTVAAH